MVQILLSVHGVIAATIFMLLIHLHLTHVKDFSPLNMLLTSAGALVWPLVLLGMIYVTFIRKDRKIEHLQRGLADGRWRTAMGRANTDYEIDGKAFEEYEARTVASGIRAAAARQASERRHVAV